MKRIIQISALFFALTTMGCTKRPPPHKQLTSINIIDRNGLSETISGKDRLQNYQRVDFLKPQPYQKVLQIYGKAPDGSVRSCITSYHSNGEPRQYLEAVNARAKGAYREWHPSGQLKLEARVVGGVADLNTAAEESLIFDGIARAWDENGILIAEIPYVKGELQGEAKYYYSNGKLWKLVPYFRNQVQGIVTIYSPSGEIQEISGFLGGLRDGSSRQYWSPGQDAADENYKKGIIDCGVYFNESGEKVGEVTAGEGWRAVFDFGNGYQLQEFHHGMQDGLVKTFDCDGRLLRTFHIKDGLKNGEELVFIDEEKKDRKKVQRDRPLLALNWVDGVVQGVVKTWYENGNLESQREMSGNKKNGMFTAWYKTGGVMMIEEYHHDALVDGEYFRKGDRVPVSKVTNGKGIANLFDADGHFLRKVTYRNGKVVE